MGRQRVGVEELLRVPFPLPDEMPNSHRCWQIVEEINRIVTSAATKASEVLSDREGLVRITSGAIEGLINEYFDILPLEKTLIEDTELVIIPSVRPTRKRQIVPTIEPSKEKQRGAYTKQLCDTLNGWAKSGPFSVQGYAMASAQLGIGVAVLQKVRTDAALNMPQENLTDLLPALERLRKVTSKKLNTFELIRGAKVFDRDRLYLVKPISQRFWTQTAALNDADEIAGTILMHTRQRVAW